MLRTVLGERLIIILTQQKIIEEAGLIGCVDGDGEVNPKPEHQNFCRALKKFLEFNELLINFGCLID